MEADNKDNANPTIINPSDLPSRRRSVPTAKRPGIFDALVPAYPNLADPFSSPETSSISSDSDEEAREEIDEQEVYDLISTISDPEHPLSLGSLGVVKLDDIAIAAPTSSTLTDKHCHRALNAYDISVLAYDYYWSRSEGATAAGSATTV